jgi:hypothetical protein
MSHEKKREMLHIPEHSVIILAKFDSEADRTKVINSKEYNEGLARLMQAVVDGKGEITTKTSKN